MSDPRAYLAELGCSFYQRGWMVGTSGNLSVRNDDGSFWITASGRHKGRLEPSDFLRMSVDGEVLEAGEDARPSAETSIHQQVYTTIENARACFHVHSVESTLVGRMRSPRGRVPLPPLEMLKGFGLWEQDPVVHVPVFDNHLDVPKIAEELGKSFDSIPVPGFLIADHGLTVWGTSADEAEKHLELFDFIFRFMLDAKRLELL